jgi:hypothetical protein
VLDEAGRARIRIARDAGGNQTRQAGLDDTENKMAMTAGNAKVHGDFRQRKGRASAAAMRGGYCLAQEERLNRIIANMPISTAPPITFTTVEPM